MMVLVRFIRNDMSSLCPIRPSRRCTLHHRSQEPDQLRQKGLQATAVLTSLGFGVVLVG